MPFLYELKLAENEPQLIFKQQLVSIGTLVGTGQAVALLTDGTMDYQLPAPRQGLLVEWHITTNEPVTSTTALARLVCEGDEVDIPGAVPQRIG